MKKAWVLSYLLSAQRRLSDGADAQADLNLRWAHMPFCWVCHVVAHMTLGQCIHLSASNSVLLHFSMGSTLKGKNLLILAL